jgi:hypothetical protein
MPVAEPAIDRPPSSADLRSLVTAQGAEDVGPEVGGRTRLGGQQVLVETRRTTHGLAGVVDDEVEARKRVVDEAREDLDARRMAQIEAVDVQPVLPLVEVGLARVAQRRVLREARGRDHLAARSQHLERGVEADLHARAGDEADAALERRGLEALLVVELRALHAHRVVEVMELRELGLADVAGLGLLEVGARGGGRGAGKGGRGGREDRSLAGHADAGGGASRAIDRLVALALRAPKRLHEALLLERLRPRGLPCRDQQVLPHLDGHAREHSAVGRDLPQQFGRATDVVEIERRHTRRHERRLGSGARGISRGATGRAGLGSCVAGDFRNVEDRRS